LKINPLAQRDFRGELLPGDDNEGIAAGRDRKVFTALRQNPTGGPRPLYQWTFSGWHVANIARRLLE